MFFHALRPISSKRGNELRKPYSRKDQGCVTTACMDG